MDSKEKSKKIAIRKYKKNRGENTDINYLQGNRSFYWRDLLGEELREKLINQAHKDAIIFHELIEEEKKEFNNNRSSHYLKTKRSNGENASRNILVRSASAAT